jgi:hypothetical protein
MFWRSMTLCLVLAFIPAKANAEGPPPDKTDALPHVDGITAKEVAAIAVVIIAASITAYRQSGPGPCACPDDTDRAGRRCGKRSARDRAGGWTVYCYPIDVPVALIKASIAGQSPNLSAPKGPMRPLPRVSGEDPKASSIK